MQGSAIRPPKPCPDQCADFSYHCLYKPQPVPTVAQAIALPAPRLDAETLPLSAALNRVTAEAIYAPFNIPAAACAAHDGIAVSFELCRRRLEDGEHTLAPEEFLRCPMGTPIPERFDTVAHAEQCRINADGSAALLSLPIQYQSVQLAGDSVADGELLIRENERLTPSCLALLQYAGAAQISVLRKPLVTAIPIGDDLLPAGSRPKPGQYIDCDSAYIQALTVQHGGQADVSEIVPDRETAIASAVSRALPNCDVLVLIGGVSKGEHNYGDFTASVIRSMGQIDCYGVRLSPGGKHLILGHINGKPVIGMPGPPHAAIIMTEYFLPAILRRLLKCACYEPTVAEAVLTEDLPLRGGGEDIWECRVVLTPSENGYLARMVDKLGDTAANFIRASGTVAVTGPRSQFKRGSVVPVKLLRTPSEIAAAGNKP